MVKFISYDGKWPCLCSGHLILEIDGEIVILTDRLRSGGSYDWHDFSVYEGDWHVNVPEEYAKYRDEIVAVVNENVEHGCCGGCI